MARSHYDILGVPRDADLKAIKKAAFFKYDPFKTSQEDQETRPSLPFTRFGNNASLFATPLLRCPWGLAPRSYHPGYKCDLLYASDDDPVADSAEFLKSSFTGAIGIGTPPQVSDFAIVS